MNAGFFIVVNARTGPSRHPYKHVSLGEAQREAERIAALSPGDKVFVLQAVGFAIHRQADWRDLDPPIVNLDDEIPF